MDKTLLKGLMVLETLSRLDSRSRNIDELAELVGLTRSNTHRTLQTLAHAGYVYRDATSGGYRCTLKMFELGARQLEKMDVRVYAPPYMRTLAEQTSETVHLSVLEGCEVVYIDKLDSPEPIRAYSAIGGRAPAYAVATGKALLAYEGPSSLHRFSKSLMPYTGATCTDIQSLRKELARTAQSGYACNLGEWREEVGGIAAPLFVGGSDKPVAALGISGPLHRLTPEKITTFARHVVQAACHLSERMGRCVPVLQPDWSHDR